MMDEGSRPQGPGLKWRKRRGGLVPYWFATAKAIEKGFPTKAVNLARYMADPDALLARAQRLHAEMMTWLEGLRGPQQFDGTFRALFDLYERDSESTFHTITDRTRRSYSVYLRRLYSHIGAKRIDACDGRDVLRWFVVWRDDNGKDRLPRARMTLAVLKAAVSFGIVCRKTACRDFQAILSELEFENVPARTFAPTAAQIIAARKAAHENGAPLRALVYALQFETTLRQEDIIGQWVPMSDPRPSLVIHRGKKWLGPHVAAIDANNILKVKPSKTAKTTGVVLSFDLSVCPMVMDEIGILKDRSGPMIVNEHGRPYNSVAFNEGWRADYAKAGLPKDMWNRDTRAGGVSEGTRSGASKDDRRRLAGHAREETTDIYDREQLEVHRRVMASRTSYREKNGS